MEPITISLIATGLTQGIVFLGDQLLQKSLLDPILEPIAEQIRTYLPKLRSTEDRKIQDAVTFAMRAAGAPEQVKDLNEYILATGFDQFALPDNRALQLETVRAVLTMRSPDVALIPDAIFQLVRWPTSQRPILATFLYELRRGLANHPEMGALIDYADREEVRMELRALRFDLTRTADATDRSARYLRALVTERGLDPDKPDAQALQEYLDHVQRTHNQISFLFVRPVSRNNRVRTEAELDAVFVPLQVYDPDARPKQARKRGSSVAEPLDEENARQSTLTINDVVARYPIFLLKGAPGSGKTTLLRHLAMLFARGEAADGLGWQGKPLLPILVPLRNFGRYLTDHAGDFSNPAPAALQRFIEDYFAEYLLELPPTFFRQRLIEGNCLILLDGFDEVAEPELRARVAQMVSAFIRHYKRYNNHFGLASRPKGYEEVADHLVGPIICDVQPLMPEGRDQLVCRLLDVLEPNPQRCAEDKVALLADLRNKEKVDELSRNPLFCTTLVLVYKYRETTLPERRVDVYQELVELLLGFWETHKGAREGVADVRELVMVDGTGREFDDERDAIEHKRRALINLADWMQQQATAEVTYTSVVTHLAHFFHQREGAPLADAQRWAKRFLNVAHQRSGLFVETEPELYAFSHQNFREYLAATALIGRRDVAMVEQVLANATDPWWEEVILLAIAHQAFSEERREYLLTELIDAGHLVLAGRCAVDAGSRLSKPLRSTIQNQLYGQMVDGVPSPQDRYAAGEVLDALGWLPDDLNHWVHCPACADDGGDLLVNQYPITNVQFARFVETDGYTNPSYWGGEESEGWLWRTEQHSDYRGKEPVHQPEYWQDLRFGKERRGYPVVGISWYEATAFAAWLSDRLEGVRTQRSGITPDDCALVEDLLKAGAVGVRLPTEEEWRRLAGGIADEQRYPWDDPQGPATSAQDLILARINTSEAALQGTSPVAMYPQGRSQPYSLYDVAGNSWEWTASWYDESKGGRVLCGGSWDHFHDLARCGFRNFDAPVNSFNLVGCRLVAPIGSGF